MWITVCWVYLEPSRKHRNMFTRVNAEEHLRVTQMNEQVKNNEKKEADST